MKKLTQAEEQLMQVLWSLKSGGYVKDILELLDEPKPHNNTVATLLKILVEKGFVGKECKKEKLYVSPTNKNTEWCNEYLFNYDNVDKNKLLEIINKK